MTSESDKPPEDRARAELPGPDGGSQRRVAEFGRSAERPARASTLRRGANGLPLGPLPAEPEPFLRNPYVLAGIAVAGAILLAVLVVFGFGSSGGGSASRANGGVLVDPLTPAPGRGVAARSIASATVREGPGLDYQAIGELVRNQDVEAIGRNGDSSWFAILYPSGSNLRGWVPKTAINVSGDSALIPVTSVTPLPRPTVVQPTSPPEPTQSATGTATPTETPTPAGGSDLAATIVPGTCQLGQRLLINVRNNGPAPLVSRSITVLLQTPEGNQVALWPNPPATLQPGQAIDIDPNYIVAQRVVAVIDPLQALGDPNPSNNRADCTVVLLPPTPGGFPTPILPRTPTPIAPTIAIPR